MRKLLICILFICAGNILAQTYDKRGEINSKLLPIPDHHYQHEYDLEEVANPLLWVGQTGLNAAFGTTDKLYFRREKPDVEKSSTHYNYTAWRGERVNMQVLVWSSDALEQVRVKLTDLKKDGNKAIPSNNFDVNMVRYVIANYPYATKNAICGNTPYGNGFMMPDRFEPFERFDLPARSTRPIWVSVDIPADTEAGVYSGNLTIQTSAYSKDLSISINVQNQILPEPKDWKHRLDLWQNPWAVAWYNHLEPWSEEHKVLLKQHLKPYAEAGGTYITTYAVHSPWSDNSYMIEGGMIEWIKQKNGAWKFDFKIFDEYVQLAMECGINRAITVYTAIPWGNRFRYMDEATGNYVYQSWEPGTDDFVKHWHLFLTDLKKHLQQKGWFDITYIGINENPMPQTLAAIKATKDHSKDWKITYAGDWHKELDSLLDDYSYLHPNEPTDAELKARKTRGALSTYYVCCNPPVPNNFLFSPPIEGRWISWYSAARGYDGFLRWAYDAWPEDPNRDARHGSWAAGDCFLIYPGGRSCIRFEKLREGIVDYEKIRIIKEKALKHPANSRVNQLVKQLDDQLVIFTKEKAFDEVKIANDVSKGKTLIDAISEELK
ncbi:MAG: glycoside hydrolase domain-containing protein [Dysgonomonas sp.]